MAYPQPNQIISGSTTPAVLGDATIVLGQKFTVAGRLYETGSGMDHTMFIDIDVARELAAKNETLAETLQGLPASEAISSLLIKTQQSEDIPLLVEAINRTDLAVTAVATSTVISATRAQIEAMGKVAWLLWLVILLLSVLALWGRFQALVRERRGEIGLLTAMGNSRGKVFLLILAETWLLAAMGGVAGSVAGAFVAKPAIAAVQEMMHMTVGAWTLPGAMLWVLYGVLLSLAMGFAAAWFPCRKSMAMEPVAAIGRGGLD